MCARRNLSIYLSIYVNESNFSLPSIEISPTGPIDYDCSPPALIAPKVGPDKRWENETVK